MHRPANPAALDRRITRAMMPRNQQQEAVAASDRLLQSSIDRPPCKVEVHPVEVEHPIRINKAAPKALVPASIEGA